MAAETEKDAGSPATAKANGANGVTGARPRRRSSLMVLAQSSTTLPSVESSLEEFIARANQTGTNPEEWRAAEHQAKAQDEARREADSLRWKAAEHQLREGEAREQALRRQLDGLQGRLAEAEARAAVAQSGTQHDGLIADLKLRLQRADERIMASEARERDLARDAAAAREAAEAAKREAMTARSTASVPAMPMASSFGSEEAEQRIAVAEAKAAKALAAARAAAAGLTVNPADLAAIESGLVVTSPVAPKGTNWLAVAGAFLGGLVIAFAVFKVIAKPDTTPAATPAPAAAQAQPAPTVTPIVTPIEAPAPAPVAQTPAAPTPAAAAPTPTAVAPVAVAPTPAPVAPAPAPAAPAHPHVTAATHHAVPAHHAAPAPKKPDQQKATGAIVDPF